MVKISVNKKANSIKNDYESLMFVKWAGGKTQLISQIAEYLPKRIDRYFEPFIGGGALFFYIMQKYKPKYACICDVNEDLIITYKVVRDDIEGLINELEKHKKAHKEDFEKYGDEKVRKINQLNKERKKLKNLQEDTTEIEEILREIKKSKREEDKNRYYYISRAKYNKDRKRLLDTQRAAFFIYFNKSGFNGMYRVNPKGEFNIPKGDTKDFIIDKERLRKTSEILNRNVDIICGDYSQIKDKIKENSFIYLDPPYFPLPGKNSFTTYTDIGFGEGEQIDLRNFFAELDKQGVKVLLSNSDTKFIKDLYLKFNINTVYAKRMINCDGKNRGEVKEILVTNY